MKKAFTLIELLVVVLIIGILSAIALPQYQRAVEKARTAEVLQNVSALQRAVDLYVLENGYPTSAVNFLGESDNGKGVLAIDITNGMDCSGGNCHNEYFSYTASCNSTSCGVVGIHLARPGEPEDGYNIRLIKRKDENDWEKECEHVTKYEHICKGLEPLGYTRSSCC